MNDVLYQRIGNHSQFKALVRKRQLFAVSLSLIVLVLYISFILLIAFAPGWLGTPLFPGASITRGIPIGIGLIVISFLLTGVYVYRANGEFDRMTKKLLSEVK